MRYLRKSHGECSSCLILTGLDEIEPVDDVVDDVVSVELQSSVVRLEGALERRMTAGQRVRAKQCTYTHTARAADSATAASATATRDLRGAINLDASPRNSVFEYPSMRACVCVRARFVPRIDIGNGSLKSR